MAFKHEHVILTVGGVLATATVAYLLYKMQARDNAANTQAQIDAQNSDAQQQASLIASLPAFSSAAPSASTTSTSAGDIANSTYGGAPAPDPALETLIAGFLTSPLNSVTLQSTPIAQITELPLPPGVSVPVTASQANYIAGSPAQSIISRLPQSSSLAV